MSVNKQNISNWNLLGHQKAIYILTKMYEQKRLPHALLITGAKGVGKYTLALALAKALNCLKENKNSKAEEITKWFAPCEKCINCRKINENIHPDIHLISRTKNDIAVSDIRNLIKTINYQNYEARQAVFIIKDAAYLNVISENALLKTLEEPPLNKIIILTTTSKEKLLPTIVSRCATISLGGLSIEEVSLWLEENKKIPKPLSIFCAALANGSLGVAKDIEAQWSWDFYHKIINIFSLKDHARLNFALNLAQESSLDEKNWFNIISIWRLFWREVLLWNKPYNYLKNVILENKNIFQTLNENISINNLREILTVLDKLENGLIKYIRPVNLIFENYTLTMLSLISSNI